MVTLTATQVEIFFNELECIESQIEVHSGNIFGMKW